MSSTMIQRPKKKQSRITKKKLAGKNQIPIHFRFGGNRKDPLNLNALIQKKKQLTRSTSSSMINNDHTNNNNNNGNDRPVEILLQPDIFDPLRLDTSSRNDEDLNNIYSIPSNSTNEQQTNNSIICPIRKQRYGKKRRHSQPPRYGNFQGYYGYRQPNHDQRFQYLEHNWFHNKQVLDVGCHTGHVTFYVAEHFQPDQIVGVDIDQQLIQQARHQLWNRIQSANNNNNNSNINNDNNQHKCYPFNLRFQQENFVLDNDEDLANIRAEYDTIIAFSVTKWVHLNFGDEGLKRFFKRIYRTLLPGGRLILEPQPWSSYRLKRRMTKDITETYNRIEFKPTEFVSYLLSAEVGFETCTTIATPNHLHKGFQRSMFSFIKASTGLDN
ncbi:unnamed protein product [Rotaria sp. Silwood2]|nr:unnamed protein product [Rotaria sp. Silwood2]CAF2568725.1 unnamed protein product [Rotaria sp. Silwood2]CAF3999086.1 unnamed protein product [Rotaria sp. Silwood2]CAF4117445.1 unnamed protein product [Rotaria sp. Silwood2]CAF4284115.1 unnamed protein product [Rotaria sp. Silwood2]